MLRYRFTAEEFPRMAEAGILPEDARGGETVTLSPVGKGHMAAVKRLMDLLFPLQQARKALLQVQDPLRLSSESQPQPDLALLSYRENLHRDKVPPRGLGGGPGAGQGARPPQAQQGRLRRAANPRGRRAGCVGAQNLGEGGPAMTRHRISLEEFHRMVEAGVFPEDLRLELVEGELLEMGPIGKRHAAKVARLVEELL